MTQHELNEAAKPLIERKGAVDSLVSLRWSSIPPSVPGWYWLRFCGEVDIREFTQDVVDQIMADEELVVLRTIATKNIEWAGPIPEPMAAS